MFRLQVLAILSVAVHATDIKQRLQVPPSPEKGFNINAYLGQWFFQFRRAPCSWPGSSDFTDYTTNLMPDGTGSLFNHLTWRSRGVCNKVTSRYVPAGPGVFTIVDNIGDSFSGKRIIAATDYKQFLINWGCTKLSGSGDVCEDPWISVATRLRYPSPAVINVIESILRNRWGITLNELQRVQHKMPCLPDLPKKC